MKIIYNIIQWNNIYNKKKFCDFSCGGVRINLQIKTPIWTGDVDSKSDSIRPTGIIGSLRWWTETLLRGMNEFACDPTSNNVHMRCPDERENYCSACLIFGAVGRRRLFRLEIDGGKKISFPEDIPINIKPSGRSHGWFFGPGIVGNLEMKIIPLDEKFNESLVLVPLLITSKWGGIGAKTQLGYGVVEVADPLKISFEDFKRALENLSNKGKRQKSNNPGFPDLKEMFFAKIRFVAKENWWEKLDGITSRNKQAIKECIKNGFLPIAPVIKNWLRYGGGKQIWESSQNTKGSENWLFGTSKKICPECYDTLEHNGRDFRCNNCKKSFERNEIIERNASKINTSCAYRINDNVWEIRIWGWIPKENAPQGFQREEFLDKFKKALDNNDFLKSFGDCISNHKLVVWREYNSKRDTVREEQNFDNFVENLVEEDNDVS